MRVPALKEALAESARQIGAAGEIEVQLERPANSAHGDLATNLAMLIAGDLGRPPRAVAEALVDELDLSRIGIIESAEVAGPGFINFRIRSEFLREGLARIVEQDREYGRSSWGDGLSVIVEFVSANPTGPLHVGHGRGAAVGDAIARLLDWTGHRVHREFYVNDLGVQIDRLVDSIEARYRSLDGGAAEIPEGGYHGAYVIELARSARERFGEALEGDWGEAERDRVRGLALESIGAEHAADLAALRVDMDEFRRESELYRSGRIQETLEILERKGMLERREGATWLRTTEFGDDKDRVLIKSDGTYTYFLPDLAYHRDKALRDFQRAIDIWGADHHGYVPRMQAALEALGLGRDFLEAYIVQLVRVERGGVEVKQSKRAGEFVTLRELIDEVGADVARYFFLQRSAHQQMVFDLDLALEHSEKNPVYKTQYAHARIRSIYRKADLDPEGLDPSVDLSPLERDEELEIVKSLLEFPDLVDGAARAREPHRVAGYLEGLANQVNSWYHAGNRDPDLRVLGVDEPLRAARLMLARGAEIVLRNGLDLLGVEAPDRM